MDTSGVVRLDGSLGEGGGQILRSALSLAMITGKTVEIVNIRGNREKPGLRPQHLAAVLACAEVCSAEVSGAAVGSRELTFRPGVLQARDATFAIGTAGATALVLQTLALPMAMAAANPVRLSVEGGTFNTKAPSYPFLKMSWREHLATMGVSVAVAMPSAGFYPRGGGRLEAWIEPARPTPVILNDRGPLVSIRGEAGTTNLRGRDVAQRMADHATKRLADHGLTAEIETADWPGTGQGAAIALTAQYEGVPPCTFVGLGERGKPAERVAEDAVAELIAHHNVPGAVDPHTADQLLLPMALADGFSAFTTSAVTEHLLTNAHTLRAFLNCDIQIELEPSGLGRVQVKGVAARS